MLTIYIYMTLFDILLCYIERAEALLAAYYLSSSMILVNYDTQGDGAADAQHTLLFFLSFFFPDRYGERPYPRIYVHRRRGGYLKTQNKEGRDLYPNLFIQHLRDPPFQARNNKQ